MITFFTPAAARHLGGALLGGLSLWWVAANLSPRDGEVVVHLVEPGAEVRLDGRPYPPDADRADLIVTRLPEGRHSMSIHRDARLLAEEFTELGPGAEVVLSTFDPARATPAPGPGSRVAGAAGIGAGLGPAVPLSPGHLERARATGAGRQSMP
jgi:hypothetical protein